jgi:type II secretory pathway pseudopilin PulG
LIAVIVVLAILAAVAVPRYFDYSTRARVSAGSAHLKTILRATQQYRLANSDQLPESSAPWPWPTVFAPYVDGNPLIVSRSPFAGQTNLVNMLYGSPSSGGLFHIRVGVLPPWLSDGIESQIDNGNISSGRIRTDSAGVLMSLETIP